MKHLKLFEEFTYTVQDFLDIPYWRYKNSQVDTIMKVEFLDNDKDGQKWNSEYRFTFFNMTNKNSLKYTFFELINKNDFLYRIINLDIPEKILRPATDEEIELFKEKELMRKYNI